MKSHILISTLIVLIVVAMAGSAVFAQTAPCSQSCPSGCTMTPTCQPGYSVADIITNDNRVSMMSTALKNTEVLSSLACQGPYTVFVPVNDAFLRIPDQTINCMFLSQNTPSLRNLMMTHIIQGSKLTPQDLRSISQITTANCQLLSVRFRDPRLYIGNAQVVSTEQVGNNGIVYYLDSVLIPGCSDASAMSNIFLNSPVPCNVENLNNTNLKNQNYNNPNINNQYYDNNYYNSNYNDFTTYPNPSQNVDVDMNATPSLETQP